MSFKHFIKKLYDDERGFLEYLTPAMAIPGVRKFLAGSNSELEQGYVDTPESGWLKEQFLNLYKSQLAQSADSGEQQAMRLSAQESERDLADMLKRYVASGGIPGEEDYISGRRQAAQQFAGQREALGQAFEEQRMYGGRQAALMGRSFADPILQAKLAQEQMRQSSQLSANEGSLAAQIAQYLPGARLGYQQQLTGMRQGILQQAQANRMALMETGANLRQGMVGQRGTASSTPSLLSSIGQIATMSAGLLGAARGGGNMQGAVMAPPAPPAAMPTPVAQQRAWQQPPSLQYNRNTPSPSLAPQGWNWGN